MSSGVSSERRTEGQINEVALEMKRIRARGGKIVMVAGPVVIHMGGSPHLAELIRDGYVNALLSGNALPVYDIETNLFGNSLGVNLVRGVGVHGGHQHHSRATGCAISVSTTSGLHSRHVAVPHDLIESWAASIEFLERE